MSAGTIAASYIIGGLIPLAPYIMTSNISKAFAYSVGFTALALILFGGIKGQFTGINKAKSAGRTLLVGNSPQRQRMPWRMPLVDRAERGVF